MMREDPTDDVEDGAPPVPIRSPIGSLRCATDACVRAGGAARAGAGGGISAPRSGALVAEGFAADAIGAVEVAVTAFGAARRLPSAGAVEFKAVEFKLVGLAKNGAGCMPDCKKMALTTMIRLAAPAHTMAVASTGRWAAVLHSRPPTAASAAVAKPLSARRALLAPLLPRRSRTFLHRHAFRSRPDDSICRASRAFLWRLAGDRSHRRR
jgi:hypothetical protein